MELYSSERWQEIYTLLVVLFSSCVTLKSRADGTSGKILKGERGHGSSGPFRLNANELLGDICTAAAATKEKCIYSLRVYKRLKKYETAHISLVTSGRA